MSHSPSPAPGAASAGASTRHARNALEKQRQQLERLLKDPAKPAAIPVPPKEKSIRPPREMMKNVQGSSAGAGSGEFHVYKASRRLEYERLKAIHDGAHKVRLLSFPVDVDSVQTGVWCPFRKLYRANSKRRRDNAKRGLRRKPPGTARGGRRRKSVRRALNPQIREEKEEEEGRPPARVMNKS